MLGKRLVLYLVLATAFVSQSAYAGKYDLELDRLWKYDYQKSTFVLRGDDYFEGLMSDVGTALAPRFLGPAATFGSLGFQISMDYSMTNIPENATRWQTVMTDFGAPAGTVQEGADSFLHTLQLHVRKGLPFSVEVGGTFTKLLKSDLWGVGLELKFAPLEGFENLPELAFRASVSTFLGTRDYSLLTSGFDAIVSKKIGLAGLFKLAPYVGYNLQYVHASSNVIALYHDQNMDQAVFGSANVLSHFVIIGFQVVATVANLGFEVALTQGVQTYSFRLGVEF